MKTNDLVGMLAYLDLIDRVEGVVSTFLNADWRGAYKRRGVFGLGAELVACVSSHNSPMIFMRRNQGWSGIAAEHLLARNGINIWDRGLAGDQLYFCVKRRQVNWAEYVLLRAGVPITNRHGDPRNAEWARRALTAAPAHRRRK